MYVYFQYFFHFIDNYTSIQLEGKNIQKPLFGHNWNCSFPVFLSHYLFPGTFPLNVLQLGVPQDSTIPVSSKFTVKISPTHAFNYHYYVNDSQILMPFPDIFQVLISVKYLLNISIWPKGHSKYYCKARAYLSQQKIRSYSWVICLLYWHFHIANHFVSLTSLFIFTFTYNLPPSAVKFYPSIYFWNFCSTLYP